MSLQTEFPERLTTLCTGQAGLRGGLKVEIREPSSPSDPSIQQSTTPPILDCIASDETLDRYDEIISVSGWKLNNYRRNPVFQNAHQYGDIIFTLGKALVTEIRFSTPAGEDSSTPHSAIRVPHLYQRVLFATDVNPMARIAYGLYKGKFLNAVSVGFIPLRWENGDGEDGIRNTQHEPRSVSTRAGSEKFRRRYLEQELLEVSAVGIPANPEALQLGLKAGAVEKADLRDTLELLKQVAGTAGGLGDGKDGTHWTNETNGTEVLLSLARELQRVLKG